MFDEQENKIKWNELLQLLKLQMSVIVD